IEFAAGIFLGEIERDGQRLGEHEAVVVDRRQPPVRIDSEEFRLARAGLADLNRDVLVVEAELLRHPERAEGAGAGDAIDAQGAHSWRIDSAKKAAAVSRDGFLHMRRAAPQMNRTRCRIRNWRTPQTNQPPRGAADGKAVIVMRRSNRPWQAWQRPTLPSLET